MAGKSNSRRRRKALDTAQREDHFVIVVPFLPVAEADVAFASWLERVGLTRSDLAAKDVMVDTATGDAVSVRQYRVFRDALPR